MLNAKYNRKFPTLLLSAHPPLCPGGHFQTWPYLQFNKRLCMSRTGKNYGRQVKFLNTFPKERQKF